MEKAANAPKESFDDCSSWYSPSPCSSRAASPEPAGRRPSAPPSPSAPDFKVCWADLAEDDEESLSDGWSLPEAADSIPSSPGVAGYKGKVSWADLAEEEGVSIYWPAVTEAHISGLYCGSRARVDSDAQVDGEVSTAASEHDEEDFKAKISWADLADDEEEGLFDAFLGFAAVQAMRKYADQDVSHTDTSTVASDNEEDADELFFQAHKRGVRWADLNEDEEGGLLRAQTRLTTELGEGLEAER